jgi:NAD dependent epimerase/dehydratase
MSDLAGRKALVTGAGGFIGGHLTEMLVRQGAEVRGLARYNSRNERGTLDWLDPEVTDQVETILGDIRDLESVAQAIDGVDVVFHLAAQIAIPYSYLNPRDFFETNVLGTFNVAQAALDAGVQRLVHTSTSEVYGTAQVVPITEDHPLEPQSPYAASKLGADKLVDSYNRSFELPTVVLRPFNTFGPFQSARAVIPTIISQALAGGPLRLGSLDPRRDMTFVTDTAAGFVAAATAGEQAVGSTVQLGTGYDVSIADIVAMVGEIVGRELEVELDSERVRPPASEVLRLISGPELAKELIGWQPTVDLREGLSRTIDYIGQNLGRYRTDEYVR